MLNMKDLIAEYPAGYPAQPYLKLIWTTENESREIG